MTNENFVKDLFDQCEKFKEILSENPTNSNEIRQNLLDHYEQIILYDLDFALEKKIENDLWTLIFKNEMSTKQDALKKQLQPTKRAEIQTNLQLFYDFAKGFYLKLLQNVVRTYEYRGSFCPFHFSSFVVRHRSCKEASILYFLQQIFVHIGDLNRYSNQLDLATIFYEYAIETIPCLGQPFNQIGILHEMKNQPLIAAYFYIRSIAIKVTFPLAKSNLEKLLLKFKENSSNNNEFLQIVSSIYFSTNFELISSLIERFRLSILPNWNSFDSIEILTILFFLLHRSMNEKSFDFTLQLLNVLLDECLRAIQQPMSKMFIDEQKILPIVYLTFVDLFHLQKTTKKDLFHHRIFEEKTTMWNSLAKLLRSFGVSATTNSFLQYQNRPLTEERQLECFTPFNEHFKIYSFKQFDEELSEKDERQLRKFRLVNIVRNLCQRQEDFHHLICYVKDDLIYFESNKDHDEIPTSNFGAPGDRRTQQKTPRGTRNVALRQFLDPKTSN